MGATQVEETLQGLVGDWWDACAEWPLRKGQLVWAFVNHVDITPYHLEPLGRVDPRDHGGADVQITRGRVSARPKTTQLPVAALPQYDGEVWSVHRAKRRPCLVVACDWSQPPKELRGQAKWQTAQTVLVAPYYGAHTDAKRAGFPPRLLQRIQCCEYPQYMLEQLPLPSNTTHSVLRLDHIQPVGHHRDSIEPTKHCLGPKGLEILDEWLDWILKGQLLPETILAYAREELLKLLDDADASQPK